MEAAMNKMVRELNEQKLEGFVARILDDLGATMIAPLVRIGDELGLYSTLADAGPVTPEELARRTGTVERLVREWLSAHAAAGYLDYDATTKRFSMNPEQAMVFETRQPGLHARLVRGLPGRDGRPAQGEQGFPQRRRRRLSRTMQLPVQRNVALLA
jgi:hypothetical protein